MTNKVKEILNTPIVLLNEQQKKVLLYILFKILKSNIFVFFVLGTIISIIEWHQINWHDNYYIEDRAGRIDFLYSTIVFMLFYHYIPFYLSIILNLIIKFTKNEKVKKVFKIIMIITNILSVLYLGLIAFVIYSVAHMFDYRHVTYYMNYCGHFFV